MADRVNNQDDGALASHAWFAGVIMSAMDGVISVDADQRIILFNPAAERMFGWSSAEVMGQHLDVLIPPRFRRVHRKHIAKFGQTGATTRSMGKLGALSGLRKDNIEFPMEASISQVEVEGRKIYSVILRDITERKRAEQELERSQERFSKAFNASPSPIAINRIVGGQFVDVNDSFVELFGYSREELIGSKGGMMDFLVAEDIQRLERMLRETGSLPQLEVPIRAKSGTILNVLFSAEVIDLEGEPCLLSIIMDITERKRAEEAVAFERYLLTSLMENTPDSIYFKDREGMFMRVNRAVAESVGLADPAEAVGKSDFDFFSEELARSAYNDEQEIIRTGTPILAKEEREVWPDGHETWVLTTKMPLRDAQGNITGTFGVSREITEHKRAEEEIRQHLRRLAALRNIDLAISGNLDLRVTLNVLLDQVTNQLGVDATDIMLLDPHAQMLRFAAGRGFRTREIEGVRLRLDEGYAGQAILERRIVGIPNLSEAEDNLIRPSTLAAEGFMSYYGAPLIAKGDVKGVLQLFHRAPLAPDEKWLDFFEVLAGQAAIAIDNAQLFDDLQRSNTRLRLAYETTIEGWSQALDLRDEETEGHTQRVTDMTLLLAQAFGIEGEELAQIRRGALLHDIGKMGVPDSILLKPGPLTEDEWVIMRKHPVYAYELLSPITYLRPALDIPYAHHEKWDGTGYPRGLKGEQIPLAARIFAVVDVWDALRNDRPYRAAWPEGKTREYIREQVGTHFDPEVVETFLKVLDSSLRS